jgi:hypothetical protein
VVEALGEYLLEAEEQAALIQFSLLLLLLEVVVVVQISPHHLMDLMAALEVVLHILEQVVLVTLPTHLHHKAITVVVGRT